MPKIIKNSAIKAYMFDYAAAEIAKLNDWNSGDNNAHSSIINWTDYSGNVTMMEEFMSINGGGIKDRDPNVCKEPTGCGTLSFGNYSGFTKYYNDCFKVEKSKLMAMTTGMKQDATINERLAKVMHDRIVNYKLGVALAALDTALTKGNKIDAPKLGEDAFWEGTGTFGLSEHKLKTLVMRNQEARIMTRGCQIDKNIGYGQCTYLKGSFAAEQKWIFKVADPILADKAYILTEGAVKIRDMEELQVVVEEKGQAGNRCYVLSYAGAFDLMIKGYDFKKSEYDRPTDAKIKTAANWSLVTDLENSAGVLVKKV